MSVSKYWITGRPVTCDDGMTWPHWALMAKRSQEGLVRLFPARYETSCVRCDALIPAGVYSYWERGAGNYCQRCVE